MAPRPGAAAEDKGLCLSMHQPWASLLVYGIKRIEGRTWTTEHRGRLWIHATSREPLAEEVQELEAFYRGLHAMEGSSPIFPTEYPTSVLLGCVEVVDCLTAEQVEGWEGLPQSLKLEVGSPHCFLCERPQRLVVLHPMRGHPKIFALEKKMHRIAALGLKPPPSSPPVTWAAFGPPPAAAGAALPPSSNKHRFEERMAAEGARAGAAGSGDAGPSGKSVRSGQATSPRAAARAAHQGSRTAAGAGPLVVPRAVALRQQQQAGESGGAPGQQAQQDPAKRLRAVQKKLRQIEQVEEKQRRGVALTAEEEEKVARAASLQAEAAALQQQLG